MATIKQRINRIKCRVAHILLYRKNVETCKFEDFKDCPYCMNEFNNWAKKQGKRG